MTTNPSVKICFFIHLIFRYDLNLQFFLESVKKSSITYDRVSWVFDKDTKSFGEFPHFDNE